MADASKKKPLLKPLPKKAQDKPPQLLPSVALSGVKPPKEVYGRPPAGRPVSNLGDYIIKPTPDEPEGAEILNNEPDLLAEVNKRYLKAFQLPPALQPSYLRRPEVQEKRRAQAISKGWRNPRSLH